MKKSVIQTLNYILFFAIGAGLLYLAFRNQNFDEILKSIKSANLWWAIPVFIAWIIGLLIRALRWKMVIETLDYKPSLANTFNTMMFGYLVNYAVPRLGEITRCMSMKKKENIPPVTLFGTVMVERVVDLIMLAIVVIMALVLEFNTISGFFSTSVFGPLYQWANDKIFSNTKLLIAIIAGISFLIYYLLKANKSAKKEVDEEGEKKEDKLDNLVNEVWVGLAAISKLKNYPLFIFYSLAIWVSYFLTSYLWFKAFAGTSEVTLATAFVVMVMGALGRSLPIQGGGMGAYHYMVSQSLLLFGIGETLGYAYAIVNHGSSSIFSLVIGAISWLILLFTEDKSEQYI
jgi:uncharacterized protein (TIRG00374 family)